MKNTYYSMVFMLLLGSGSTVHSISEQAAYGLAGVSGVVGGCIGRYVTSDISDGYIWTLIPAAGCGYLGYKFFYRFTPAGRIQRAKEILSLVRQSALVSESFKAKDGVVDRIKSMYVTEWPLITAYNDLVCLVTESNLGMELAFAAKQEDSMYRDLGTDIIDELRIIKNNMTEVIKTIRDSSDYLKQLELYKEEKRREKELAVMQSQANAQWHQANAQYAQARATEAPKQVYVHHTVAQ